MFPASLMGPSFQTGLKTLGVENIKKRQQEDPEIDEFLNIKRNYQNTPPPPPSAVKKLFTPSQDHVHHVGIV